MQIALYTGGFNSSSIKRRIGAALTRLAQKGDFDFVTHCEAILGSYDDGTFQLGSSAAKHGGVRILEHHRLEPDQWLITPDVPMWNAAQARLWFLEHEGEPYDWRGAWATMMPGHRGHGYFCSEAVLASVGFATPYVFTPSDVAAIAYSLAGFPITQAAR